jgi:hypothetical protein
MPGGFQAGSRRCRLRIAFGICPVDQQLDQLMANAITTMPKEFHSQNHSSNMNAFVPLRAWISSDLCCQKQCLHSLRW